MLAASDPGKGAQEAYSHDPANTTLNPGAVAPTGGSQPHENMQPYLAMNYVIALEGIFPSRG